MGVAPRRSTRHQTAEEAPEAREHQSAQEVPAQRKAQSATEALERQGAGDAPEKCEQQNARRAREQPSAQEALTARAVRRAPRKRRKKRTDPTDGKAYARDELLAFYKGKYQRREVEAYWAACRPQKGKRGETAKPGPKDKAKWKVKSSARRLPRDGGSSGPLEGGEAPL